MEHFFLDLGFSWTTSKVVPYVIWIIVGVIIYLLLRKRISSKLRRRFLLLLIPIPVVIYFAFKPIYEGDFSNNYRSEVLNSDSTNIAQNTLTVIAIPGCPYCSESINRLNKIVERVPKAKIEFVVLSSDEEQLKPYRKLANKKIKVRLETAFSPYQKMVGHSYPTFVFLKNGSESTHVWNNDSFGVIALDMVESELTDGSK